MAASTKTLCAFWRCCPPHKAYEAAVPMNPSGVALTPQKQNRPAPAATPKRARDGAGRLPDGKTTSVATGARPLGNRSIHGVCHWVVLLQAL